MNTYLNKEFLGKIMTTNGREYDCFEKRVKEYYNEEKMSDGRGGILQLRGVAELALGVVSVLDSLGEVDILYDLQSWEVCDCAQPN